MVINNFNWKIGGEAGYGIASAGAMFTRAMLRSGLFVFDYSEYPSLIRGAHNTYEVSVSNKEVYAVRRPIHVLIALDQKTADEQRGELADDAAVIFDSDTVKVESHVFSEKVKLIGLPLEAMADQAGAPRVARNVVGMGASFALLKVPFSKLREVIELNFKMKHKEGKVVTTNIAAAKAGYDYIQQEYKERFEYQVEIENNQGRLVMAGNDAIVWGAIQAGCKFLAQYPMTPATGILHGMAAQARKYRLVVKHVEDEISAMNTVIAAGYTGVRAMTATSGGGFCLMTEAWGMAGMMEAPVVAVEVMRTGPSSGMPTWGGQEDLRFVLSASHGEFPRVIFAPGDVEECFMMIQYAFNIAEKYQTPVMILSDKYLAASHKWVDKASLKKVPIQRGEVLTEAQLVNSEQYLRYRDTDSGVSPRVLPGTKGGVHISNSDEHNEAGFSEEGASERTRMVDKRFRKEALIAQEMPQPELFGDKHADITLVSWGSTKGVIRDSLPQLAGQGVKANHLHVASISPFPKKVVQEVFKKAKKVAVVEGNKTAQFAGWIREQTGLNPDYKILKYDGRPFFIHELVETIKKLK